MKRYLFIILIIACASWARGQSYPPPPSQPYQNLQKYWWYRYKLVNDFMLIGDQPGESIPAQRRYIGSGATGSLKWADATIDLGHYMQTLAAEDRHLASYGFSLNRTEWELFYALRAYDRLDSNAEEYCYGVNQDYPGHSPMYPGSYPGTITMSHFNDPTKNGFFIRDDVPFLSFIGLPGSDNFKHFNRPGLTDPNYTGNITDIGHSADHVNDGDFNQRYSGVNPFPYPSTYSTPPPWYQSWYTSHWEDDAGYHSWPSGVPVCPGEESQDQLVDIFMGLAFSIDWINNPSLQQRAADAAYRSIEWPTEGGPSHGGGWLIKNPVNGYAPVYGVGPQRYGDWTVGGAWMGASATPASRAAHMVITDGPFGYSSQGTALELSGAGFPFSLIFQVSQYFKPEGKKRDIAFTDNYVTFAADWTVPFLGPLGYVVPHLATRISWTRVRNHSMSNHFGTPHLPLIFQLNYPSIATGFSPESHGYVSYNDLLNNAPFCGTHDYLGDWNSNPAANNWEWGGNDRLSEPYHRPSLPDNENADFNGLDYMELFTLYCLTHPGAYLRGMINPYYAENFSTEFPDGDASHYSGGVSDNYGSSHHQLTLNWLEYVSAQNKIHKDGYVTFRGAKSIDLVPGFETDPGSVFTAYVHDYSVSCTDANSAYNFASVCFFPIPSVYNDYTGQTSPADDRQGCYNVEYYPWGLPNTNLQKNTSPESDSNDYYNNLVDSLLASGIDSSYKDSLIDSLYATGDTNIINYVNEYLLGNDTTMVLKRAYHSNSAIQNNSDPLITVNIYPNPNNGDFTIKVNIAGNYEIRVLDMLGQVVYQDAMRDEDEKQVHLADFARGSYLVEVTCKGKVYQKKISVVR